MASPFNLIKIDSSPSVSDSLLSTLSNEESELSIKTLHGFGTPRVQTRKKRSIDSSFSSLKYPDFPVKTQCSSCSKLITTQIHHKNGKFVYILAMGLFSLTVVLFWVPFVVDSCKDVTHSCPNCGNHLGTRHRLNTIGEIFDPPIDLNLCSLPTEILLRILYELILSESPNPPKTAVTSLPLVCKIFYMLSHDRIVWEQVFMSEYDVSARKRRFVTCNFRKIFFQRSQLNVDTMDSSLRALDSYSINDLSQNESTLNNVLNALTCLWVLVSENDGRNSKKLLEMRAPEFCSQVFHLLYADMDSSLKHLACIFISIKIISMLLVYGPFDSIIERIAVKLRGRVIRWDPNNDVVFPMLDCHALHIYLLYFANEERTPVIPESSIFDSRKCDKWLQWTHMVDVYSSNKILWCLRNDGYDWPKSPQRYWTGLVTDNEILTVEKLLLADFNFMELEIVAEHSEEGFENLVEKVDSNYVDSAKYYILDGSLTDDNGKEFIIEGESIPIDKGRRVNFVGNKVWNFCGFMTAFGIIGRCWLNGVNIENAGFFWLWEDI
ncbi:6180_t:CDS:2 [Racocetra persica]|uniref:6180_t:CDS:1 n=1 Tax=Racocetra persica TaxID=160502 RepID=A0ACA9KD28_9GLOM|nr:6180_t:CDS:2 [Racocetra persica]